MGEALTASVLAVAGFALAVNMVEHCGHVTSPPTWSAGSWRRRRHSGQTTMSTMAFSGSGLAVFFFDGTRHQENCGGPLSEKQDDSQQFRSGRPDK
jgi:hypothetical protein